jgi:hypothetical protein
MPANVNVWAVALHDAHCNEQSLLFCTSHHVWEHVCDTQSVPYGLWLRAQLLYLRDNNCESPVKWKKITHIECTNS